MFIITALEDQLEYVNEAAPFYSIVSVENPDIRPDLGGANFGGANLSGADLAAADLQAATFVLTDLTGADLTGCRIHGVNQACSPCDS